MNRIALLKQFKPYQVRIQTIADLRSKSTRLSKIFDEKRIIKRKIENQCSKSKNRECGNIECPYNLLKYNYFEDVETGDAL